MKKVFSYILIAIGALLLAALVVLSYRQAQSDRAAIRCRGLEVKIVDSSKTVFITPADVKAWLDSDLGGYVGTPITDIDLRKVETTVLKRSAVKNCEAFVGLDSALHVMVSERRPVIRFQTPSRGFYADRDGYLFPLQRRAAAHVPVIDGELPLDPSAGINGEPVSEKDKAWVNSMTALTDRLSDDREWRYFFVQIHVESNGEVTLIPRSGKERFLIGQPVDFDGKLHRIKLYYTAVAPSKDPGYYRTVNVKFEDRIICKK